MKNKRIKVYENDLKNIIRLLESGGEESISEAIENLKVISKDYDVFETQEYQKILFRTILEFIIKYETPDNMPIDVLLGFVNHLKNILGI
ncbi:hypothetical protein [uncultured Algibacter sp.]|uniref:hypothetical protein n=1 Tax=uncultured Algibacter sp. TaxID=298659 RepID=UPI002610DB2E|nr:hypothetical protein [uncultured Algibacter sp.]